MKTKTMTTQHLNSIDSSLRRCGLLLIPLVLSLALTSRAEAGLGSQDTAYGDGALASEAGGDFNSAFGYHALFSNTTGLSNSAFGHTALYSNTTGNGNTATGLAALVSNTTGNSNTATGDQALVFNTTGDYNTATGLLALALNSTASYNTATGYEALYNNTTGTVNTAEGAFALYSNTTGNNNTATGSSALVSNTTGYRNTAIGFTALRSNTTGHGNTAIGFQALYNNYGSNNIGLGFKAGSNLTNGSGNVCIGYNLVGVAGESNTTRIGNVYASVASGRAVYVNSDNKIGTLVSSRRFKDEIKPMDKASEAILALQPVTFHYKKEIEPNGSIMFGLIAEEVEKVDPDLVTRNDKGEPETVRYDAVNAMLLNEFLKEHHKVQQQETTIANLKSAMAQQRTDFETTTAQQQKQIEALAAGLQKVSAHIEMRRPAPQTVVKNE